MYVWARDGADAVGQRGSGVGPTAAVSVESAECIANGRCGRPIVQTVSAQLRADRPSPLGSRKLAGWRPIARPEAASEIAQTVSAKSPSSTGFQNLAGQCEAAAGAASDGQLVCQSLDQRCPVFGSVGTARARYSTMYQSEQPIARRPDTGPPPGRPSSAACLLVGAPAQPDEMLEIERHAHCGTPIRLRCLSTLALNTSTFCLQRRQRPGVTLLQLLHAPGEPLGQPLHLVVDGGPDAGAPLVLDHQRLDLGLGERGVASQHRAVSGRLGPP